MEIVPYVSIGDLSFGDTRQVIRQRLGGNFESFHKGDSAIETDAYDELGLHLYFDKQDRLEFVEAFEPASPTFRGIILLGRNLEDIERDLTAIGYEATPIDVGLKFDRAGIAFFAPTGVVEGVSIFRRGYFT